MPAGDSVLPAHSRPLHLLEGRNTCPRGLLHKGMESTQDQGLHTHQSPEALPLATASSETLSFVSVLSTCAHCMCVHHVHAWYLQKSEEGSDPLELELELGAVVTHHPWN